MWIFGGALDQTRLIFHELVACLCEVDYLIAEGYDQDGMAFEGFFTADVNFYGFFKVDGFFTL